ncbi:Coiled-coil domain protein [Saccharolobus shibatae B12]|uniref:Coiled-coil domain protein n=1 Tax=Saccharolobus shibatae (strain ATCC 51178 / DSM 5389 / JCM 8931 / NBRC 15437 / B12) TaxID=523848 RepID=A0A8F5BKJ3_SACSH|nr:cell division protein ZapB [Saccharolobus shibatae]QXJ27095.1 Coiled-coil domain protein [Saccharolobus shibatae B12]QXJ29988.1 Coiled-coil domain protein [Saccharolobus shibatae B12]
MTINEIIEENEELQLRYSKAIDTITKLQNKIAKLQKENERLREENISLKDENKKLQKQNNILMRAIEIAIQIRDYNAQKGFLKKVLEKLRETGELTR